MLRFQIKRLNIYTHTLVYAAPNESPLSHIYDFELDISWLSQRVCEITAYVYPHPQ